MGWRISPSTDNASHWVSDLGWDSATLRPLRSEEHADVCIVGGGYTGLWTALRVKELEPSARVVVVEANYCGSGASGRNGGFVLNWWSKFPTLAKLYGTDEGLRIADAAVEAVDAIGAFCEGHGLDVHYRRDGWLWTASNDAQVGAWEPVMNLLERVGRTPFTPVSTEDLVTRTGTDRHVAGVHDQAAATVHPARLAWGLRTVAQQRGIDIFELSPMTRLDRGRPPRVRTAGGMVTAPKVVLAMNAWSVAVRELRPALVVIGSDMVATERLPERLDRTGWKDGVAIADSRMLVHYYHRTADGRIAFGFGGGRFAFSRWVDGRFGGPSRRRDEVASHLWRLYPGLRDARVTSSWTGPIDRSVTSLPFFGALGASRDIWYGVGYSGNGVGPSWVGGRILASLALEREDEWSAMPLAGGSHGRFPPEPFRFLGGSALRAALSRKEGLEDRGRRAGRALEAFAALAPQGLVPTKPAPAEPRRTPPAPRRERP